MNKRFLSFIAAAALLLSAGACSSKNDANNPGQDLKDAGSNQIGRASCRERV